MRLLGLCLLVCLSSSLTAQTIAIKGSATLDDAVSEQTRATGQGFVYHSYLGDGSDSYGFCISGQICDGSSITTASAINILLTDFTIAHSSGCLNNVCSRKAYDGGVGGMLNVTYTFSFITPSTDQSFTIIVPIAVTGSVEAPDANGQPLWTVDINGTGSAKLCATVASGFLTFHMVDLRYTGQATVVGSKKLAPR